MVQSQCLHVNIPPRQRLDAALTSSSPGRITEACLSGARFYIFKHRRECGIHRGIPIGSRFVLRLGVTSRGGRAGAVWVQGGCTDHPRCHHLVLPARGVTVPGSTSHVAHDTFLPITAPFLSSWSSVSACPRLWVCPHPWGPWGVSRAPSSPAGEIPGSCLSAWGPCLSLSRLRSHLSLSLHHLPPRLFL